MLPCDPCPSLVVLLSKKTESPPDGHSLDRESKEKTEIIEMSLLSLIFLSSKITCARPLIRHIQPSSFPTFSRSTASPFHVFLLLILAVCSLLHSTFAPLRLITSTCLGSAQAHRCLKNENIVEKFHFLCRSLQKVKLT